MIITPLISSTIRHKAILSHENHLSVSPARKGRIPFRFSYLPLLMRVHISSRDRTKVSGGMDTHGDSLPTTEKSKGQLLGIEGYIADKYFSGLRTLFYFPGRQPQGRDKFNSALNYGYGILYNEVERACLYVGLDPYMGLYHSERYGKPALVLDLVEEFRVPVVDVTIFPLFIEKKLSKQNCFESMGKGQYQLSPEGKSIVVKAVMENLNKMVTWHGKSYTLKAVIENQIRALARYFTGQEEKYAPFDAAKIISTV